MVLMSGGAWSETSRGAAVKHFVVAALWYFLRGAALQHLSSGGGCFDIFCGSYLDITWHLLESCFTAFLRRAAFTAYFEAAFFAEFFGGSCFVACFGGGCFAAFFRGGAALRHFWRGDLERPLRSLHTKTISGYKPAFVSKLRFFSSSSFFFADQRRNKDFQLAESPFFSLS